MVNYTKVLTVISALFAYQIPTYAQAQQPQTITLSSIVTPQYFSGKFSRCQLGFEVVRHDPENSGGELVYLTGNLGFQVFNGREPNFSIKLGVAKVEAAQGFKAPAEVYLIHEHQSNASEFITSIAGDETGFRIFAFSAGDITLGAALQGIARDQKLVFAYSMTAGGLSAIVPVDLTVENLDLNNLEASKVSDKTRKDWNSCFRALLDAAK